MKRFKIYVTTSQAKYILISLQASLLYIAIYVTRQTCAFVLNALQRHQTISIHV